MTKDERIRAFAMRLEGAMWEDISEIIGYSPSTVREDLLDCIKRVPKQPNIPWPGLREYVNTHCQGNVKVLALTVGIKPSTMYSFCSTGKISEWAESCICKATGMSAESLFGRVSRD